MQPITQEMIDAATIHYYWVDGGGPRTVTAGVTIGNKYSLLKQTTFNVQRPSVTVDVAVSTVSIGVLNGAKVVSLGSFPEDGSEITKGIEFTRSATTVSGYFSWTQIISTDSTLTTADLQTLRRIGTAVDGGRYYPIQSTAQAQDSPYEPLHAVARSISRDDDFSMYLMWQSPLAGSIRVPLRRVDWSWGFAASSTDGTTWSLDSGYVSPNPTVQDTTDYPIWSDVLTNITWTDGN